MEILVPDQADNQEGRIFVKHHFIKFTLGRPLTELSGAFSRLVNVWQCNGFEKPISFYRRSLTSFSPVAAQQLDM